MEQFSLDRLLNDMQGGTIRGFDIKIDPAHGGKPEHIDLHVFQHEGSGVKYAFLGGTDILREQLGRSVLPEHLTHQDFGF